MHVLSLYCGSFRHVFGNSKFIVNDGHLQMVLLSKSVNAHSRSNHHHPLPSTHRIISSCSFFSVLSIRCGVPRTVSSLSHVNIAESHVRSRKSSGPCEKITGDLQERIRAAPSVLHGLRSAYSNTMLMLNSSCLNSSFVIDFSCTLRFFFW